MLTLRSTLIKVLRKRRRAFLPALRFIHANEPDTHALPHLKRKIEAAMQCLKRARKFVYRKNRRYEAHIQSRKEESDASKENSPSVGSGENAQLDEPLPSASDSLEEKVKNYEAKLYFPCGIIVWNKILLDEDGLTPTSCSRVRAAVSPRRSWMEAATIAGGGSMGLSIFIHSHSRCESYSAPTESRTVSILLRVNIRGLVFNKTGPQSIHMLRGVRQQQDEQGLFSICSRQAAVVQHNKLNANICIH